MKLIAASIIALLLMPLLALAGTFEQVIAGSVNPEIALLSSMGMGTLTVGKTYYYAGDGAPVEANANGPTAGAVPVITANVASDISAIILLCNSGNLIDSFYSLASRNLRAVTIYYDRDTQFGNGNEVELADFNPDDSWIFAGGRYCGISGHYAPPNYKSIESLFGGYTNWLVSPSVSIPALGAGEQLYLAIESDDYGPEQAGGEWKATVGLTAAA